MITRTLSKRIGKVQVFELYGDMKGSAASELGQGANKTLEGQNSSHCLIFNALRTETFDEGIAKIILERSKSATKSVLITRNPFMVEKLFKENPDHQVMIFERESDAVQYLGQELSDGENSTERRLFPRLKVALPVQASYKNRAGKAMSFFSVAINLSLSGMFTLLMDETAEHDLRRNFDVFDFKMLQFILKLPNDASIIINGKMMYFHSGRSGLGVEFHSLNEKSKIDLQRFLNEQEK